MKFYNKYHHIWQGIKQANDIAIEAFHLKVVHCSTVLCVCVWIDRWRSHAITRQMSNTLQINLSEWNTNGVNRLVLFDKVVHFAQGICINSFHFMGIAAPPRFESNSSRKRISNSTSFFSKLNGIQKFFPIWHTFLVLNQCANKEKK